MDLHDAILGRRTHKVYGGGSISRTTLERLIEAATWAPNHGHTEPWRFYVVHGADKLAAMNSQVQATLDAMAKPGDENATRKLANKKRKMATRLEKTAAVVVVTWSRSPDDPFQDQEDYAATACAIQNLLLSAHAEGFGSLWSTSKMLLRPELLAFYGIGGDGRGTDEHQESVAGVIFLGTPAAPLEGRRHRPAATLTHWV